ncbi:hypothetical protein L873DRAFT_1802252 [Choiromyces venosus 120613-1]|uniref:Poly A polymerase C-terminal region-like protein n=1 Tax=Choiromyces venosus 120613-1 TaxID=1336337 RepID=A0A3N4JVD0_9PEZI|nr:hypothetical protein L873DRAFT_1802252 [Choiromyces venosus 120613-1]
MSQAKLRLPQLLLKPLFLLSPRNFSPRVLMAEIHSRSQSPANKPDQKRRRLISNLTTAIQSSPSPTNTSNKYSTMATPATPTIPLTLTLSSEEAAVRKLFIDAAQGIDRGKPDDDRLVLRFTGGWVRDKLLGGRSVDIDVGINNMSGFDFATRLSEHISANMEKYGFEPRNVNKIESNPEKSKHLETATTKILGLDIDFVNLRSETYSEDSRVPHMEFGTPEKDALRRDCTINALFYNLHTEQVEDFTGLGLQDMAARLIRTPLPPKETFTDDPLRVLRLIRFASRLDFTIVPEAKAAMKLPEIKSALKTKISRERVGIEIEKMLRGRNPHAALSLIHELDLYNEIFAPPVMQEDPVLPVEDMKIAADIVRYPLLGYTPCYPHFSRLLRTSANGKYLAWLIASMSPWKHHPVFPADRKRNIPAAATAIKEGLKCPNTVSGTIANAFANYPTIENMVLGLKDWSRSKAGMEMRALGADWRSQVGACFMFEVLELRKNGEDRQAERSVMDKYETFLKVVAEKNLEEAYGFKGLLTGKDIVAEYSLLAGPWVKPTLERCLEHQLDHPQKEKEELLQWARENRKVLLEGLEYVSAGEGKGKGKGKGK